MDSDLLKRLLGESAPIVTTHELSGHRQAVRLFSQLLHLLCTEVPYLAKGFRVHRSVVEQTNEGFGWVICRHAIQHYTALGIAAAVGRFDGSMYHPQTAEGHVQTLISNDELVTMMQRERCIA